MEILGNKGLLLKLRNPKKVIDVIEGAKSFEDNKVLVDWNLENVQKLTEMGVKVESTINRDYTYTGMFNPFNHLPPLSLGRYKQN